MIEPAQIVVQLADENAIANWIAQNSVTIKWRWMKRRRKNLSDYSMANDLKGVYHRQQSPNTQNVSSSIIQFLSLSRIICHMRVSRMMASNKDMNSRTFASPAIQLKSQRHMIFSLMFVLGFTALWCLLQVVKQNENSAKASFGGIFHMMLLLLLLLLIFLSMVSLASSFRHHRHRRRDFNDHIGKNSNGNIQ